MNRLKLGFFVGFGAAVIGCTSLLGDFEVSPAGGSSTDTCTGEQTLCGSTCVDTKSSTENCGACNRACPTGLACSGGNCQCPDKGAFCDGQCYPSTDREHCGPTCITCQGNQVCQGGCVDPPAPAFDKAPRSATGWKDAAGQAIGFALKATGQPGTIYECRTGPAAAFTADQPAWTNCDGAAGDKPEHHPAEAPGVPEGTYRTEYRYKLGAYVSPVLGTHYYVHKSLDGVATCPRQGVPVDGPHFSDEQFFAAATAFAIANVGSFPIASRFPDGGDKPDDAIYLGNPWIKIPFTNVHRSLAMNQGENDGPWPNEGQGYLFNERSLRHKWVINGARNMILVTRQYIHPKTNDCKQLIPVGANIYSNQFGPPGRGFRKIDCEGYVLNTRGNALCLGLNGDKIAVQPADMRIPVDDAQDGGQSLGSTFSTTNNSTLVTSTTAGVFTANMKGGYLQIPESPFGKWFQIQDIGTNGNYVYLTEPTFNTASNQKVRFTAVRQPDPIIDTGYAKLHEDAHSWATGDKLIPPGPGGTKISHPMPSHLTKCDTPGCNTGKPWLTYLPR